MKKYVKKALNKVAPSIANEISRLRSIDKKVDMIVDELSINKHDFRIDRLKDILSGVEHYQPAYNLSGIIDSPMRNSRDRCVAIENKISPLAGKRMLDIGSSLGYVSFYMADRGVLVQGWEENVQNAEAARMIGELNGIGVDFRTKEFNSETVKTIPDNEYDVVTLLSVVHHIIRFNGIDYTKKLIKDLMDKTPVLIVELAKKGEDPSLPWDSSQPENELDIFELIKDEVKIEKIGDFKNHLSNKTRPLYLVSKTKILSVNSHSYEYETVNNVAYEGSPVAYSEVQRRYYYSDDFIAKEYMLKKGLPKDTYVQILNEITVYERLSENKVYHLPKVLDFEISNNRAVIVFKRIPGKLLSDEQVDDDSMKMILTDILKTIVDLRKFGYSHNDIRPWNIIVSPDKKKAFVIDYGLAGPIYDNNDIASSLQLIVENSTGSSARNNRLEIGEILHSLPKGWDFLKELDIVSCTPEEITEKIKNSAAN